MRPFPAERYASGTMSTSREALFRTAHGRHHEHQQRGPFKHQGQRPTSSNAQEQAASIVSINRDALTSTACGQHNEQQQRRNSSTRDHGQHQAASIRSREALASATAANIMSISSRALASTRAHSPHHGRPFPAPPAVETQGPTANMMHDQQGGPFQHRPWPTS